MLKRKCPAEIFVRQKRSATLVDEKLSVVKIFSDGKKISSGKHDLKGNICCRKIIQRKNCENCQMNTGLAVLVKICKRKRDVIDSGGSSYRYFKKHKIFNTSARISPPQ